MQYGIALKAKSYEEDNEWYWFNDSFLPGFRIPERVLPLLMAEWADDRGFCPDCNMDTHCHPINAKGYKYCTILFHDAIRPKWKLKDVV